VPNIFGEIRDRGTCANADLLYFEWMTEHQPLSNISYLRLSLRWQADLGLSVREQCWDALVAWCDKRGAYLGGKPANAVILHSRSSTRVRSQLARWLSLHEGIASFELSTQPKPTRHKSAETDSDANPQAQFVDQVDVAAVLEALGNYQQHLIEEFSQTVGMLPRLQRLLREPSGKTNAKAPDFVREAVARMRAAPRFLSQKDWDDLASYDGPIVSGDPEGRVPDNLDDDDNE
jgi:hypothetical protein